MTGVTAGAAAVEAPGAALGATGGSGSDAGTELKGAGRLAADSTAHLRNLGSSASRRPSETKFTEIANRKMMPPGMTTCHQGK